MMDLLKLQNKNPAWSEGTYTVHACTCIHVCAYMHAWQYYLCIILVHVLSAYEYVLRIIHALYMHVCTCMLFHWTWAKFLSFKLHACSAFWDSYMYMCMYIMQILHIHVCTRMWIIYMYIQCTSLLYMQLYYFQYSVYVYTCMYIPCDNFLWK